MGAPPASRTSEASSATSELSMATAISAASRPRACAPGASFPRARLDLVAGRSRPADVFLRAAIRATVHNKHVLVNWLQAARGCGRLTASPCGYPQWAASRLRRLQRSPSDWYGLAAQGAALGRSNLVRM